jgi:hypothetical protein
MRHRAGVAAVAAILVTGSAASAITATGQDPPARRVALPTVTRTAPDTASRSEVRGPLVSRTTAAPTPKPARTKAPPQPTPRPQPTRTHKATPRPQHTAVATTSPKSYALARVGSAQFACLDALWTKESNWNPYARNPTSGAYGIAQALPASKYASAGSDWETNAITQIRWGLGYIKAVYGTPCTAWAHSQATNWY